MFDVDDFNQVSIMRNRFGVLYGQGDNGPHIRLRDADDVVSPDGAGDGIGYLDGYNGDCESGGGYGISAAEFWSGDGAGYGDDDREEVISNHGTAYDLQDGACAGAFNQIIIIHRRRNPQNLNLTERSDDV